MASFLSTAIYTIQLLFLLFLAGPANLVLRGFSHVCGLSPIEQCPTEICPLDMQKIVFIVFCRSELTYLNNVPPDFCPFDIFTLCRYYLCIVFFRLACPLLNNVLQIVVLFTYNTFYWEFSPLWPVPNWTMSSSFVSSSFRIDTIDSFLTSEHT